MTPATIALVDKVTVVPAMRNGVRGQRYMVSREYAQVLVSSGRAYWAGQQAIYEILKRGKV